MENKLDAVKLPRQRKTNERSEQPMSGGEEHASDGSGSTRCTLTPTAALKTRGENRCKTTRPPPECFTARGRAFQRELSDERKTEWANGELFKSQSKETLSAAECG